MGGWKYEARGFTCGRPKDQISTRPLSSAMNCRNCPPSPWITSRLFSRKDCTSPRRDAPATKQGSRPSTLAKATTTRRCSATNERAFSAIAYRAVGCTYPLRMSSWRSRESAIGPRAHLLWAMIKSLQEDAHTRARASARKRTRAQDQRPATVRQPLSPPGKELCLNPRFFTSLVFAASVRLLGDDLHAR
eukprot:4133007-Prymnesium_polylepis.1